MEAADFVLVVNKKNPLESMDRSDVKKIFLGKKTFWPDGQGIDVVLLAEGEVHQIFAYDILNKSPRQLTLYWKQELFSGTGVPPKQLPDNKSVKAAVASNPQAIGYVDILQFDESVKKIKLD
ncbi:MAG: substrate-binding domain-containing protein [Proteobacteria bacterium]|nr:substrate-binding domain-containing protein [Pseudomonadota bacterium]MBU1232418.1 substrate-binding domain-containing protein [Pseudomonadota bacterium]MBU1417205.1 substrate-binding domain-containing protein [Pseudomonadota bacterium]MBU1453621.1 substrate-binding domain-containing protein [Pseudomonadota bacterium]